MPEATRQSNLFVAEDWKVIYRAFTEVNFSAYDFDTIRGAMIDYIRLNFPEDFNDWIESSEFVAIIELLAYLGQSLAFRTDLNTRENFFDTAERRESVLRLSRLVSFQPQRNRAASGLVKITQLSTTQALTDSNGTNISNKTVRWNDPINPDWFEQFILVMNSCFSANNPFGRPKKEGTINSIPTQLYEMNNDPVANRVFPFGAIVNNENLPFEIVNCDFTDNEVFFEREPDPLEPFHIIYRNDGKGNASEDTGFFMLFKQGTLQKQDYNITIPIENRVISVNGINVNNTDVFVHEIDEDGFIINEWDKVPAVVGNNIIFNSLEKNVRNIFSVITRPNDQISVRFADGRFGNVPVGTFRVWYRESANSRFTIKPENIRNSRLDIPYFGNENNDVFFASFTFSLQASVSNSAPSQSSLEIKQTAPQVFYTQDRMVNGEDYNVFPLRNDEAARIKAANRIHSGFSRHIDINDPTGKSQNVNMFAEDGLLYLNVNNSLEELALPTSLTNEQIATQVIQPITQELQRRHFFYYLYPRFQPTVLPTPAPIAGARGTQFVSGTIVYTPGTTTEQQIIVSDGITDVTVDLTTLPGTVDDAISDIQAATGFSNLTTVNVTNNAPVGFDAFEITDASGKTITLTQVNGDALSLLGVLPGVYPPRVYGTYWRKATNAVNSSTGRFFIDQDEIGPVTEEPIKIGNAASVGSPEFHMGEGSLVKFNQAGWVAIVSISGDGDTILTNGDGAVLLAENVSEEDFVEEIIMPFDTTFDSTELNNIITQINQKNTFGLRYDVSTENWVIITGDNLASENVPFSLENAGNTSATQLDSSWMVRADFSPTNWRFTSRGLDYVYESADELRFYFATGSKIVNPQTGRVIRDFIKVLKVNSEYVFEASVQSDEDIRINSPSIPPFQYTQGETILIDGTTITLRGGVSGDPGATHPTPVMNSGSQFQDLVINGSPVTATGTTVDSLVDDINNAAIANIFAYNDDTRLRIISDTTFTLSANVVLTGDNGATYINGETIVINGMTVTLSTGTDVASAAIDITNASIPGVTAANVGGSLVIAGTDTLTLAEGSGTALGDLGFIAGTYDDILVDHGISETPAAPQVGQPSDAVLDINAVFLPAPPPPAPPAPGNPNRIQSEVAETGELVILSASVLGLEEGNGTALNDLGFAPGQYADFTETTPCNGLGEDITFNIEDVFTEEDGFIETSRIKLTFTDTDEDGVPDDPTIFEEITKLTGQGLETLGAILPDGVVDETELFWEAFNNTDGYQEFAPTQNVVAAYNNDPGDMLGRTPSTDIVYSGFVDGNVLYFRDTDSFYIVNGENDIFEDASGLYFMRRGRDNLLFQWKHFAPTDNRIDPAISNIIDMYVLTVTYDTQIRQWIDNNGNANNMPLPPTNEELQVLFTDEIQNKMLSDEIVWHPVKYKLLFGSQADELLQARFKVTKVPGTEVTDGEIKSRIINAINEFFAIGNFDFGETFYYTELAAFIHQRLATIIGSIVLVPLDEEQKFGDLFQVRSNSDEVFISAAKVSDIQIVESFNDNILRIGN